ncbi:hypothetical protein JTF06_14380 [Desemzia sp. RIT804]|uniref:hypothetical protein n=1 Tax=Desemzia sp. RIT 804 TaxID=2810209 RepID=UPI00194DF83C|nr:hypothetical protein [Desemzia sp. RIT 804]MBM6616067.1 hypothetical protein [Desemzia sp. RIT 804]
MKEIDLKEKEKKHKLIFSFSFLEKYSIQKKVEKLIFEWNILSLKRGTKVALFLLEKTDGTCAFFPTTLGEFEGSAAPLNRGSLGTKLLACFSSGIYVACNTTPKEVL